MIPFAKGIAYLITDGRQLQLDMLHFSSARAVECVVLFHVARFSKGRHVKAPQDSLASEPALPSPLHPDLGD
jgi:hypothetical protein